MNTKLPACSIAPSVTLPNCDFVSTSRLGTPPLSVAPNVQSDAVFLTPWKKLPPIATMPAIGSPGLAAGPGSAYALPINPIPAAPAAAPA